MSKIKSTNLIRYKLSKFKDGYVFTYKEFITEANTKEAIIKALNRMVSFGKLVKLSKGKYYKPESTMFGNLKPNQYQVVKDLLEHGRNQIGYLTGLSIYNQLGLTTQISNIIQIGRNEIRPKINRGNYIITFIKQKNIITKNNIPLLQLLDAIRYIKKIPDNSLTSSCKRFLAILSNLITQDKVTLIKLSLKYPPSTRALLGALLDECGDEQLVKILLKSLNPITTYNFSGIDQIISTTGKWNIK